LKNILNCIFYFNDNIENMNRRFVIGDIHGCSKTLKKLLFETCKVQKEDSIYFLGDYIDRGPNSKKVIDRILKMKKQGYNVYPVLGNHEVLLLDSANFVQNHIVWFRNGAKSTLKSFGINYAHEFKSKYIDFFRSLPHYYLLDDYIIVHGGLNFSADNPLEDKESMVWIRDNFVDTNKIGGRKLVCGHTPTPIDLIIKSLQSDKIMLDGGCVYYGRHPGLGYLVALELNSMQLFFHRNIDI
jgi:serine/threonine protein phosphatase 1